MRFYIHNIFYLVGLSPQLNSAILMQLYETSYPIGQYYFVCDVFDVEEDDNDDRVGGGHGVVDDGEW